MLDIVPYLQKKKQTEYSKTVYISELDSYTMSEKLGPDKAPIKSKIVEEQLSDQHLESFKTLDTTFEGLREMFEGDSADTCAGKFTLVLMGDPAEVLVCTGLRERGGYFT